MDLRTFAALGIVGTLIASSAFAAEKTSCVACHENADLFEGPMRTVVEEHAASVHAAAGIGCHDCHGGNPDPALTDDMDAAMSADWAPDPFRGAPAPAEVPTFCGRCHSDPTYMRKFVPDPRVDQLEEYWTSQHGKKLRAGMTDVATCVSCHGSHRILAPSDPQAPVYPTHVAETCASCHSDPKHMRGHTLADGQPIPTDQYGRWRASVHAAAMFEKEDLSAPTCNDCHGNHGAAPPGVASISYVCGHCHGREADLFRKSDKEKGFAEHNALMEGGIGCASCHDAPDPAASLTRLHTFTECATCHGNHSVVRPTVAMLTPLPEVPCAFCHESPSPEIGAPLESERIRRNYERTKKALLAATTTDPEGRYNALVDEALHLAPHTIPGTEPGERTLRPEFRRLFQKFRIGKTTYSYTDRSTGKEHSERVVRCNDCHAKKPSTGVEPIGLTTSERFIQGMREVTVMTARAERTVLAAQRGGVEVREAPLHIDKAVDAQIELEVLVHSFHAGPDSAFDKKKLEGMDQAKTAMTIGRAALKEIVTRHRGLAASLVIILLVLIALGLKIRAMSRDEPEGAGTHGSS